MLCPSEESGCAIATVHRAWQAHTERNHGAIVRTSTLSAKLNWTVHSCTNANAASPTEMATETEKLQAAGVTSVGNDPS